MLCSFAEISNNLLLSYIAQVFYLNENGPLGTGGPHGQVPYLEGQGFLGCCPLPHRIPSPTLKTPFPPSLPFFLQNHTPNPPLQVSLSQLRPFPHPCPLIPFIIFNLAHIFFFLIKLISFLLCTATYTSEISLSLLLFISLKFCSLTKVT